MNLVGPVFVIMFDDRDVPPEVFGGEGAEVAAHARFEQVLTSYNANLFQRIDDGRRPLPSQVDQLEEQLANITADYHSWRDAYLRLKYPGMGERVFGTEACKACDGSGVTVSRPAEALPVATKTVTFQFDESDTVEIERLEAEGFRFATVIVRDKRGYERAFKIWKPPQSDGSGDANDR